MLVANSLLEAGDDFFHFVRVTADGDSRLGRLEQRRDVSLSHSPQVLQTHARNFADQNPAKGHKIKRLVSLVDFRLNSQEDQRNTSSCCFTCCSPPEFRGSKTGGTHQMHQRVFAPAL